MKADVLGAGGDFRMVRFLALATACCLYAVQSYACSKRSDFGFEDFLFADVVIEARVVGYRPNPETNVAYLDLDTIKTLKGFAKESWTVDLRPFSTRVPKDNLWRNPVLIPLRGRILENGEFTATVIDKICAPLALFQTDREPGSAFKARFEEIVPRSGRVN